MTDSLLQNIEEKVGNLLSEVQALRNEIVQVKQENIFLRSEQDNHAAKLQALISLLDVLNGGENNDSIAMESSCQTEDAVS
ncbi:MAG: hypothetical protein P4M12_07305 [Gammaproteobacteria bacterium]|nr:hypothetical protein [Gammaproteobacteria bacterium]